MPTSLLDADVFAGLALIAATLKATVQARKSAQQQCDACPTADEREPQSGAAGLVDPVVAGTGRETPPTDGDAQGVPG